ncbi:MAG: DUF692 family protein [Planctomycetes bacterium]|nr:DUF692 family protein [Planctomycetota bacterium]
MSPTGNFLERVRSLPRLGVGISTEYEAGRQGLCLRDLVAEHGDLVRFLEVGADLARGVDQDTRDWVATGRPTTYHFLDLNLEQAEDLDPAWVDATAALARELQASWLCGDAGIWHLGPRDLGHGTLMPPILVASSARDMAANVRALRERSGFEILPENPPAQVWVGDLDLLDYFALMLEEADTGMLLDVAHLAIHQEAMGREPLDGLDGFPLERVIEIHVAGGRYYEFGGRRFIEDDHGLEILDATWRIHDYLLERASNLKAIVLEAERNPIAGVAPIFARLAAGFGPERGAS